MTTLDSRVIRITRWLLEHDGPRSTAQLAADLGLSERVVRYRLPVVERYLRGWGAELTRRRGSGLLVEADADLRRRILDDLTSRSEAPRVYTPAERARLVLAALLWAAPAITSLEDIHRELEVSKASARRDLHAAEPWLERNGLALVRRPGRGLAVVGTERQIRRATVQLVLETLPEETLLALFRRRADRERLLARLPVGLRERLLALAIDQVAEAVAESPLSGRLRTGRGEAVFALYLAVTVDRLRAGHRVEQETGLQRSVMHHPVSELVDGVARELVRVAEVAVDDVEVAAITEFLLGLDALEIVGDAPTGLASSVIDRVLSGAAERLHPALADDAELRRSLGAHLERLAVRLRHGLPAHNPLLAEVRERYPDVFAAARALADGIGDAFAGEIGDDEVGFLTMYLSGALERARLRPRRRALVVCPSGMATAWVLVSRVQAEFPELELAQVLSEQGYDRLDHSDFDLVISTVPVPERGAPVVVVGPLLPASDVERVSRLL
ncbi:MAG: PRD domain-containing protein [Deltaproteobacteria bacterium]|nr:MAG: PRD domain-containing protein [Deltaproteobacteria bacterium]